MFFEKAQQFQRVFVPLVPRPRVELGLEVPETSVMSFSLPGRRRGATIISSAPPGQARRRPLNLQLEAAGPKNIADCRP
jgi:hypothetical protein